jgi:uncharacterized Fe-S cluster-containing radical SAM superfamily protein
MATPFNPQEVIFAPTSQCNLSCEHCRVDRTRSSLNAPLRISDALTFLEDCAASGIDRVGFSGGEPFLEGDFLESIIKKAVELDMYFDRLMTNGVWWHDDTQLETELARVLDAGFDGTIGISVDDWHAQKPSDIASFIRAVGKLAGRYDMIEIISVTGKDGSIPRDMLESVASMLDAKLVMSGKRPISIRDSVWNRNSTSGMDDGSGKNIAVSIIEYSPGAGEADAWKAERWFTDDWCAGPGNVLYVHADGSVAVCCGFANENSELIAGHVSDGCQKLIETARTLPHVKRCYEQGLASWRKEREAAGMTFPGKASDICFFCDWLCKNNDTKNTDGK